jgi:hypothetical protein
MGFSIRQIDAERTFCQELTVDALHMVIPPQTIDAVLTAHAAHASRARKLTMTVVVWILIAMNLYTTLAIAHVIWKVAQGLRFLWPDPDYRLPGDTAFSYRRYHLGARPLVALFHTVCRPIATPQTPGAFLFGLRLMALDGTVEVVPDTPANANAFGRFQAARGSSAFPQIQGVYLIECGTHAIVDAGFWPYATSERIGGFRLLRSVTPDMLVMWDRGFHDYDMLDAVRQRGAHGLGRLPAQVKPQRVRTLADGSYLADLTPSDYHRRTRGDRLLVRIIEYTLTDPALPGYGERYRLVTTLLDAASAAAYDLACAYHERWEIEIVIDEVATHQRLAGRPLRSQKPVGVIQELYALLIAHFAIRVLMHEAALQAGVDPDRLSFVHALRVLQDAILEFQITAPEDRPRLYARLLRDIAAGRLPARWPRSNPRVVKRKMSSFRLKRAEHAHPPKPTVQSFREAVVICVHGLQHAHANWLLDLSEPFYQQVLDIHQSEKCLI